MGLFAGVDIILRPGSLLVLVNCLGGFIVVSSSLLGPVSLLGRKSCVVSLLWRVHCSVEFIVSSGFFVGPRSLLVLVHCWGGCIVAWGSLLASNSLLVRGHS